MFRLIQSSSGVKVNRRLQVSIDGMFLHGNTSQEKNVQQDNYCKWGNNRDGKAIKRQEKAVLIKNMLLGGA